MFERELDARLRVAAFNWLSNQVLIHGETLPRKVLADGFDYQGRRVPLLGPQGIFKPALMEIPLSITTSPNGPYDDAFGSDGLLRYRYRGIEPSHRDNRGLRFAMEERLPLVYFHGLSQFRSRSVAILCSSRDTLAFIPSPLTRLGKRLQS